MSENEPEARPPVEPVKEPKPEEPKEADTKAYRFEDFALI